MPKKHRNTRSDRACKQGAICAPTIKLHLLLDAPDRDGLPRAALVLPPSAGQVDRRPVIRVFHSLAAALATKQALEGG
jgi:hypothetical protein